MAQSEYGNMIKRERFKKKKELRDTCMCHSKI